MTAEILFDWLKIFDSHMSREVRNTLLLIYNCSAHVINETFPELLRIEGLFLSPNTTSKNQPCDAGIISALKVRYRRFQMERSIYLSEENASKIYKVCALMEILAFKNIGKIYAHLLLKQLEAYRTLW